MTKHNTSQHIKTGLLLTILLMLSAVISVSALSTEDTAALTITAPNASGVKQAELDEFATNVMGDPWDMNQATDLDYYRTESNMVNSTFSGGVYSGQLTAGGGGERITLLTALAPNNTALRIGKTGYTYPINADYYKYLTLRIYKSCSSCTVGFLEWYSDDTYTSAVRGMSNSFSLSSGAGWQTVVIPLHTIGIQAGSKNWSGTIRELLVHPVALSDAAGATIKLDWARLTAEDPRVARPYNLQWTGGAGTYTIYASLNDRTLNDQDVLLKSGVSGSSGSTQIQTGTLAAGTYYIAIKDGNGAITWSPGPLIINDVPQISILSPSMESGTDYATAVLGDAWDMNGGDVNDEAKPWQRTCTQNDTFANGIFSASITACPSGSTYTDPIVYIGNMNVYPSGAGLDPLIDTSKYRYLTFRYYLSGQQDVTHGWIARFGWWQVAANDGNVTQDVVMSRDIVLYEGWNTYKVDLWASDIVDEYSPSQQSWKNSAPNRLRFDPAELATWLTPATFQIDWIKLTAVEEINQGDVYQINYETDSNDAVDITFYYDTDTNPAGRTLLNSTTQTDTPTADNHVDTTTAASYTVFLPAIMNTYCSGNCLMWDTGKYTPNGAVSGEFYVCAEIDDGLNSIYRCSETTITVR